MDAPRRTQGERREARIEIHPDHGRLIRAGKHEALVTRQLFDRAQEVLALKGHHVPTPAAPSRTFEGV